MRLANRDYDECVRRISHYHSASGPEGEWQPGSRRRVLRNLQGVIRKEMMDQLEYDALVASQAHYLNRITIQTRFTSQLLREMHHDWLGRIYAWAGDYRSVELMKGGFCWPPSRLVARNMGSFSSGTLRRYTPCHSGTMAEVAKRIATVHAELLLIHPFRDGNGRLARWLADLMAQQAGLPAPEYAFAGKGAIERRGKYLEAVKRGYAADYRLLVDFFVEALERALRTKAGS